MAVRRLRWTPYHCFLARIRSQTIATIPESVHKGQRKRPYKKSFLRDVFNLHRLKQASFQEIVRLTRTKSSYVGDSRLRVKPPFSLVPKCIQTPDLEST